MKRAALVVYTAICFIVLASPPVLAVYTQAQEEQLGREYAKDVDQQCKFSDDQAMNERVERIGQALAKIANEVEVKASYGSSDISKFKYVFKVVDDKDVNAFSLPGGHIYVNSGLVELAESDDEIAGVIAHEIAHSSHHHMMQLIRKQNHVDRYVALITLAGILTGLKSQDLNNLLYGAHVLKTGKMSSYTMEAERDADRTAVAYLVKSQYKPEGILSFMRKLDARNDSNPTLPLGIYQDHPAPFRRVASIAKAMKEEGIDIDLRKARGFSYATCKPTDDSQTTYEVAIGSKVFYCPASLDSGKTSKQRAEEMAAAINKLLDQGIRSIDLVEDPNTGVLKMHGKQILKIESADAALMKQNDRALLDKARSAIEYAIWADWLCDRCEVVQQAADGETSD